jgi:hypothetical protein
MCNRPLKQICLPKPTNPITHPQASIWTDMDWGFENFQITGGSQFS